MVWLESWHEYSEGDDGLIQKYRGHHLFFHSTFLGFEKVRPETSF